VVALRVVVLYLGGLFRSSMTKRNTAGTVLGLLLGVLSLPASAQVATLYSAGASSRTFNLITGGQLLAGPVFDDAVIYTTIPTVFFNGSYYSDMYVSTNGFLTFGTTAPTATTYLPLSGSIAYAGAVSPFGANLINATTGTPEIRWQQVGAVLVVQWRDMARAAGGTERFTFQARIDTDTGVIVFQYGPVTNLNALTTLQPQVGLRGPTNTFATQVKNFLVGSGSETWLTPLAGTANTSTMRFTSTAPAKSPGGTEAFSFAPGCLSPTASTSVTSNCAGNNFTVTVSIASLGTAGAANITASPGGTLHTNVGVGSYVCGPFTLGTPVTLNLVHSTNAACTNVLGVFNPTPTCTTMTNGVCILDPPYPSIPDNGCSTGSVLQATINMSGLNTTLGPAPGQTFFQSLELIIAHTYRGDLEVYLTSPSGQRRPMLVNAPTAQAAGSNFGNPGACPGVVLQLRDVGGQPLSSMDPDLNNISGIFTPQQSLSGFTGNPNGDWVLTICDGSLEDAGSLRFVRLRLLNVDCAGTPGGTALPGTACNDFNANTTNDVYGANCVCAGTSSSGVNVNVKGFLEGPYNTGTGLMSDALRMASLIPATEPYTALGFTQVSGGGETVAPAVLAVTGNNAIVDWVLVELRSAANNTVITRTRCGLIQRDGDVVDVDGTSPLSFPSLAAGNYFVALRHRNHQGVMTLAAVGLSSAPGAVDFSNVSTSVFGTAARKTVGTVQAMWTGNARRDTDLKYTGSNNDRDVILVKVGSTTPNNTVAGYFQEDVNMDGSAKYTGSGNDRDPILVNVGSTTPNNVRIEQLP
jgi:subtilisin-like proprotein convertase family protein